MAIRQSTMEDMAMKPTHSFWSNKRVLVTGHSGFKGSWLSLWLTMMGAKVTGISLAPSTRPNLYTLLHLEKTITSYYTDIRDNKQFTAEVKECAPDIVFHLAAQPLVRSGYHDPLRTFSTNIMGTANLLDALRGEKTPRVAVIITTDKVYQNQEWHYPYREHDTLGGRDPYSASKTGCELVVAAYRDSFLAKQGVALATGRAGNVIGGGDWADDRLIPDAIRAWQAKKTLYIRSPHAIRPWQHVLEPLAGYMILAEKLWQKDTLAGAYNFGPESTNNATVKTVIEYARQCYGGGAAVHREDNEGPHEANLLSLDISKTSTILAVKPCWSLDKTITRTIDWYKKFAQGSEPKELCRREIYEYEGSK